MTDPSTEHHIPKGPHLRKRLAGKSLDLLINSIRDAMDVRIARSVNQCTSQQTLPRPQHTSPIRIAALRPPLASYNPDEDPRLGGEATPSCSDPQPGLV
jgi:hypothetical protein